LVKKEDQRVGYSCVGEKKKEGVSYFLQQEEKKMEALAALREHLIKGKNVKLDGEDLVLLDLNNAELQRFPKSTETAFHSKSSKKPYDLLAVYTCYKYASLNFSEYVTKCRAEKAAMVLTIDKKELIAYLKGDIETSAQISASKDQQKAQGDATAAAVPESKKRKISHEEELQHKQKEHRR
jgi:parafibromin